MITTWRFPIILALSIVFGLPALRDLLMLSGDLISSGASYLAALGLSWFGVNAVFGLLEHYARHNRAESDAAAARELEAELLEIREREMAEEAARNEGVSQVSTLGSASNAGSVGNGGGGPHTGQDVADRAA